MDNELLPQSSTRSRICPAVAEAWGQREWLPRSLNLSPPLTADEIVVFDRSGLQVPSSYTWALMQGQGAVQSDLSRECRDPI